MDEKPLFILKPKILNAILPIVIKFVIRYAVLFLGLFLLLSFLSISKVTNFNIIINGGLTALFVILSSILFSLWRLIILSNTHYLFFKHHLSSYFKFIKIKKHVVPYNRITDIIIDISLWDRICNAGDVKIKTADNSDPDLILYYLPEPEKVQKKMIEMIRGTKPR